MASPPFDRRDAAAAVQLAQLTELALGDLRLPEPWQLLYQFTAGPGQGFIAKGQLPSSPAKTVALIALGLGWRSFMEYFRGSERITLLAAPAGLGTPAGTKVQGGYGNLYSSIRPQLWQRIIDAKAEFGAAMPVIITGLGPGAPLAQLAALDLLPGHEWSSFQSPATELVSYTFSSPAFADARFADFFNRERDNVSGFAVNLATKQNITVDFYPTAPGPAEGYALAGQQIGADGRIDEKRDCPWVERSARLYKDTLDPESDAIPAGKAKPFVDAWSSGYTAALEEMEGERAPAPAATEYDPTLSWLLSKLAAAAYRAFQHPALPYDVAPFSFQALLQANGVTWGAIFIAADKVGVAFRGTDPRQDLVSVFGGIDLVQPSWIPAGDNDLAVLSRSADLYAALRDDLRQKLARLGRKGQPVYFTGHDHGGVLASLAALDLTLNPVADAPSFAGVYTYGAPPCGSYYFRPFYLEKVGAAKSFQLRRPLDEIPKLSFGGLARVGRLETQREIPGGDFDPDNGSTWHALETYLRLLDPTSGTDAALVDAALPAIADEHFESAFNFNVRRDAVQECTLDTANNAGQLTLSWDRAVSSVAPAYYDRQQRAHILLERIVVRAGHTLRIESPHGQEVRLIARDLLLGPGSRVIVTAPVRLHLGALRALDTIDGRSEPPTWQFIGSDGINGRPGPTGPDGPPGAPGQQGGWGVSGGWGEGGGDGGRSPDAILALGTISGHFSVFVSGGTGGNGGKGGDGGAGGIGGSLPDGQLAKGGTGGDGARGGNSGSGGDGSTIHITYREIAPDTKISISTPPALAGLTGLAGNAGAGGRGNPNGAWGTPGTNGSPGHAGAAGQVILRPAFFS
jgi:hypothetical protein